MTKQANYSLLAGAGMALAVVLGPGAANGGPDWPVWRGSNHDGVSTEKGLLTTWPADGLKQLWKAELGMGYSGVSVSNGKVYGMGNARDVDTVFCLDAETGKEMWKQPHPCAMKDNYAGTRSTPTMDGKSVYTLGMDGQVFCFDADTGKVLWNKDLVKELGVTVPRHKFGCSPVVEGDLLLFNVGTNGLALDKKTGNPVWKSGGDSSYASAVPFALGGKRCVAIFAYSQLLVLNPANGQKVAAFDWKTDYFENIADPIVTGDKIFISSDYGRGCALVSVAGGNAAKVWENKNLMCYYASPVLVGENIYGLSHPLKAKVYSASDLVCLDAKDGSLKWTQKDVNSGGLIVAAGKLMILTNEGDLLLAEASPAAYKELARVKVFPIENVKRPPSCSAAPVLCNGRVYAHSDKGTLVCLDVRGK